MEGKIHVYCINLKSRPDRWARFSAQPELEILKGQYPFDRFEAVNGASIDVVNDKRISMRTKRNILKGERRSHDELESAGGVGCYLSHVEVWKKFLDSSEPYAIVFEDDAEIPLGFTRNLQAAMNDVTLLPKQPDIWWFDQNVWIPNVTGDPRMLTNHANIAGPWITNTCATTAGYLLTKAGAQRLLDTAFPIEIHVDTYMCLIRGMRGAYTAFHRNVTVKQFAIKSRDTDIHLDKGCAICDVPTNYPSKGIVVLHLPIVAVGLAAVAGMWWLGNRRRR